MRITVDFLRQGGALDGRIYSGQEAGMTTVNSRKTNEDFGDLHSAMETAKELVARDVMDGLVVSSVTINRHEHRSVRGDHTVRYFVEVNAHD
jgi:hypothetical protein